MYVLKLFWRLSTRAYIQVSHSYLLYKKLFFLFQKKFGIGENWLYAKETPIHTTLHIYSVNFPLQLASTFHVLICTYHMQISTD